MRRLWTTAMLAVVLSGTTALQAGDKNLSAILRGNYTTSSKIFFSPNAATEELRNQYFELEGVLGFGVELRYQWPGESFFFTLSADYLSKVREQEQFVAFAGPQTRYPVVDGFFLIPVEFGVHTYIPLGSETVRFSMGGGVSVYYGERIFRVADVDVAMQNRPIGVGIHIASGFEYRLVSGILLRGDMKFRDPELKTVSRYTQAETTYDGNRLSFPLNDISGRINVNGMTFSLGVVVEIL